MSDAPKFDTESMWRMAAESRTTEPSPRLRNVRRSADAARSIIARMVSTGATEDELATVADLMEQAAAVLARYPQGQTYGGFSEAANSGDLAVPFEFSPMLGHGNPLAPPLLIEVVDDTVVATATFSAAYEGPPGCVHGGYVAAAFDELLGAAQSLGGNPGMTGTLTVRYRKPTPLHVPLRFEATLDRTEGRKNFTSGRVYHEGALTAEAEGIFISVATERFAQLIQERNERLAGS